MSRLSENAPSDLGGTSEEDDKEQLSMEHPDEITSTETPSTAAELAVASTSSGQTHSPSTSARLSKGKPGTSGGASREHKKIAKKVSDEIAPMSFDCCYGQKGTIHVIPQAWKPKVNVYPERKRSRPSQAPVTSRNSTGSCSKPKKPKLTKKQINRYSLNAEKIEKSRGNVAGDEAEDLVIKRTKAALEEIKSLDDPPVFLYHNQHLFERKDVKVSPSREGKVGKDAEIDVMVLHPSLGILILEVKAWKSTRKISKRDLNAAATQLETAQDIIKKEVGDFLEKDAFVLTIALPNLQQREADDIRKKITRTDVTKQLPVRISATETAEQARIPSPASATGTEGLPGPSSSPSPPSSIPSADVTDPSATSNNSDTDGGDDKKYGGKGSTNVVKASHVACQKDHPEYRLLLGSTAEVFTEWVERLQNYRGAASHAFKGSSDEERLKTFKVVCERLFRYFGVSPGKTVKDCASIRSRFHLTAEQEMVCAKDCELLHISGPAGSGKTLLLIEKAKEWINKGRLVALETGLDNKGVLPHYLSHSICTNNTDKNKVVTHRTVTDLMNWLSTVSPEEPVSIILDEARPETFPYSRLLEHAVEKRIQGLWSADTRPLLDQDKRALEGLGGQTAELTTCLRCPSNIINLANTVGQDTEPVLLMPEHPVIREVEMKVTMISHPEHDQSKTYDECPTCTEGVHNAFTSLGLRENGGLALHDCIVITTEKSSNRQKIAEWLQSRGLAALAEKKPAMTDTDGRASWALRIINGIDEKGNRVMHVVNWEDFEGLERPVVMLWHEDKLDMEENNEGEVDDEERDNDNWEDEFDDGGDDDDMENNHRDVEEDFEEEDSFQWEAEEREIENLENKEIERGNVLEIVVRDWLKDNQRPSWFRAITRSMGHLIVFIVTPTQLLPLLKGP